MAEPWILGDGWTPMLTMPRLASKLDLPTLLLKDESLNPTGSFKARGLSMAISKAKELDLSNCIIPTAGNLSPTNLSGRCSPKLQALLWLFLRRRSCRL